MTEATQAGAAQAAPQPTAITTQQAATMLAERRAASAAEQTKPNPSDAARILGQRAAEARRERQAQAPQSQESAEEAEGDNTEDDSIPTGSETHGDEAANDEQPSDVEAGSGEPEEAQTIELEPGLKVTLDDVRAGFMLKADHTRKTQALAEDRKAFEADRTQRLPLLDNLTAAMQAALGQPKPLVTLMDELGEIEGLREHAKQQARFEQYANLIHARQQEQAHHLGQARKATVTELSTKHGDKAESVFTSAVQYVASKTGTDSKAVEAMLLHPEAVGIVLDAMAHRELKAKEPEIKRSIADKPRVIKPGAKVSAQAGAQSSAQNARAKLKSSGSLSDAVAYLQAQRSANPRT